MKSIKRNNVTISLYNKREINKKIIKTLLKH